MITKKNIQLEMDRKDVEYKIGKPFKISSSKDLEENKLDTLFYKEYLWTGGYHVTIENILIFKNDVLKEISQGKEVMEGDNISQSVIVN